MTRRRLVPRELFRVGLVLCTAVGLLADAPLAEAKKKRSNVESSCTGGQEGTTETLQYSMRVRKKKAITIQSTISRDLATGQDTQTTIVTRGKATALRVSFVFAGTGTVLQTSFGKGFKGVRELAVTREGDMFRAIIDGRQTTLFRATTDPKTIALEDGQPAPRFRARRDLRKAFAVFTKLGPPSCVRSFAGLRPAVVPLSPFRPLDFEDIAECLNPFDTEAVLSPQGSLNPPCQRDDFGSCDSFPGCNGCKACCYIKAVECSHAAALSAIGCAAVAGILGAIACPILNEAGCISLADDCSDGCRAEGNPCCPKICSNRCTGPKEWICCGQISGANSGICPADRCCGSEPGKFCCSSGQTCRDAASGLCCEANAGETCFFGRGCCPAGQRCINGTEGPTCCPEGQGLCGFDDNGNDACCPNGRCCTGDAGSSCCAEGQVCLPGGICCAPGDVCGDSCCPSHVCLNGNVCCAPPNGVCGGECCPPFGFSCCNNSCCNGDCLGGICCPQGRSCGQTCCSPGTACVNPTTGTCQACPPNQDPCAFVPGGPTCCPTGQECCINNQCCAPGMQCCDPPVGGDLGCHPTEACVR